MILILIYLIMILLDNNYCSKYWFTEEIQDCSINNLECELDFELIIEDEKLKDNYNNIIINNKSNADSKYRNSNFTPRNRENEDKSKIRKAIKHIAHKNSKLLSEFRELHPDCGKSVSKYSDQFNKIVIEAMGGHGDNDTEKEDKIIKNIEQYSAIIRVLI